MARTYNQDCVLAYALDLLGERWTLLIVRELFLGPRRFGDLHAALPGIGTNLLSKRLKELEEADIVMTTSKEARSQYRLTDMGENMRPALRELMFWSIEYFMKRPEASAPKECIYSNDLQPDSVALAAEMFACKCAQPHDNYVLQLTIDDSQYTYFFMNGEMTARRGADTPAVARMSCDVGVMMRAMRGEIYVDETLSQTAWSGNPGVVKHFIAAFTPGTDVAFEVAELIKRRQLQEAGQQAKARAIANAAAEA
ncbi:MAG: hypothetical protein GC152_12115 [Alphaproteobacteria bacterium]|nr:hypothetical protein [Alphaproteobacteria bacterium]